MGWRIEAAVVVEDEARVGRLSGIFDVLFPLYFAVISQSVHYNIMKASVGRVGSRTQLCC
jgi:hypothetical protein